MADQNPTGDERVVLLDLPPRQLLILSKMAEDWQAGYRGDLQHPERLPSPENCRREAAVTDRLLAALSIGQVAVPDEELRTSVQEAVDAHDRESNYQQVIEEHDALYALLARLDPATSERTGAIR
ncbi:MAG: hypothetical protein U0R71_03885 [Solirubrobacterales bacterium]